MTAGGESLSGGQRLLIARVLIRRSRLLFFDKIISALDYRTEDTVRESLDRPRSIRLVVTDNLSTESGADCIYVMDKGRIVEQGTCGGLMRPAVPDHRPAVRNSAGNLGFTVPPGGGE